MRNGTFQIARLRGDIRVERSENMTKSTFGQGPAKDRDALSFPKELDGARVLYYSDRGTFDPVYYVGGEIAHNVYYLAICKYDNDNAFYDNAFYVFHVDENLEVVADDCWDSIETCMELTERYGVEWHEHKESK